MCTSSDPASARITIVKAIRPATAVSTKMFNIVMSLYSCGFVNIDRVGSADGNESAARCLFKGAKRLGIGVSGQSLYV